ncbi:Dedicator Of Cytokinesis Protein 10 [Manis pentadactyla]|nr:Dedicator Of Cytokinesis Protein 10 [Manis pentadactyla]
MAGERTRRFTRSLLRPGQAAELRHSAAAAAAGAASSRRRQQQQQQQQRIRDTLLNEALWSPPHWLFSTRVWSRAESRNLDKGPSACSKSNSALQEKLLPGTCTMTGAFVSGIRLVCLPSSWTL